jgi:hypothetical protein
MIAPKASGELQPNIGLFRLSLVAILVGAVTGFGAIGFRGLIGLIHNVFFWDVFRSFMTPIGLLRRVPGAFLLSWFRWRAA